MGQAHSRLEKPMGFWHRHKPKAAKRNPSQESFVQISPPPLEADHLPAQMDQPSVDTDQSSTAANMTPASAAPCPDMHDVTMAESDGTNGEAGNVDKVEEPADGPHDQPTASQPDEPNKASQPAEESTSGRPALKREHTPPQHIHMWNLKAWEFERSYASVHEHLTKTLNRIRKQQQDSNRTSSVARQTERDVYKAADSCTLALEYLVGNFSTKFFHHTGPEDPTELMATIEADVHRLDELRQKQVRMVNFGYKLEQNIIQTERHIRELAELAKRIRDGDVQGEEDGDVDAEGDTDPEVDGANEKAGVGSC